MTSLRRTWAIVLSITVFSVGVALWSTPSTRAPDHVDESHVLLGVTLEHDGQRIDVRPTQGARSMLTITREGQAPKRHMVSARKTKTVWDTLGNPGALSFVELPSPGALDTYGLTPKTRATLTLKWRGGHAPTQWTLGDQRFGAGGFYAIDARGRVGTLKSPSLRWMRYAMTHLPSNEIVDWSPQRIKRVEVREPKGQPLVGTQHQLDTPDYAYWQWEGRKGASRVLARWVRQLLRPRIRGPLEPSRPPNVKDVLHATLQDDHGDQISIVWAMDETRGWVSAQTLEGHWAPVRRKDVVELVARHAQAVDAAKHESLYEPLAPGTAAHKGHAH